MKIEVHPERRARRGDPVKVGNVYEVKSGKPGYFIVISVVNRNQRWEKPWNNVVLLRVDGSGNIVRGLNQPQKYVEDHHDLVGFIKNMPDMKVNWEINDASNSDA